MRVRHATVFAACCTVLVSCTASKHERTEKYYLVAANIKLSYWLTSAAGLVRAAKDMGVAAEMVGPDTLDPNAENQALKDAIATKPAGILVSVSNIDVLQPTIDSAVQQGIPVIAIDSDAPASKRLLFVGTNNHQAGMTGGKLAIKLTGGKATAVVYTNAGQPNLEERLHGYKDAFADSPGMKIAQVVDIKGDPRQAFDFTDNMLKEGKIKPDAYICLEAIACKEVADVLNRQKVSGKTVIAMDSDPDTLDWIKKGLIAATIGQKPFTMAYFGTKLLDDMHHDKTLMNPSGSFAVLPAFVDTGTTLIDKTNVDDFLKAQESANAK